jgi:SOS response regulatory protein OraA/RecX
MIIKMMMAGLQNQNPTAYAQINQWMSSGKDPNQILNELIQSGRITQKQIDQAKSLANQIQNTNNKNLN